MLLTDRQSEMRALGLAPSDSVARAASESATLLVIVGVVAVVVIATLLVLCRRPPRANHVAAAAPHTGRAAAAWLVAAAVGGGILFHVGVGRAIGNATPEPDALDVRLTLRGDDLEIQYPNGALEAREWVLPSGRNLALTLRNEGAPRRIVSPDLGVDIELGEEAEVLVPARFTSVDGFRLVDESGTSRTIRLIPAAEFETRLNGGPKNPYCSAEPCTEEQRSRWGKELFEQNACMGCHSRDGSRLVGPTFRGLFGRRESLTGGEKVLVDATYIAESVRTPTAKVVEGYAPVMPAFRFNNQQIDAIVAYAKTLEAPAQ